MNIKLTHPFLIRAHDLHNLLNDCNKLSTFCSRLEKQSQLFPERYDPDKYKGDGFELFVEALIKLSPTDNRLGIGQYQVITEGDVGVDGYGIGANGNPATVQVKYRGKHDAVLTANGDHLSNFLNASTFKYDVSPDEGKTNRLIITTAKGLHFFTESDMLHDKVRCVGQDQLRQLVDNNQLFWDGFRKLCEDFVLTLPQNTL